MNGIPTLTDIEIEWRKAGSGICIIVEGQTPQDDPWFYNQWFGGQARRFTFFPQDGWEKVVDAVAALRPRIGNKRIYGIIDRDFEPIVQINPFPADGILRTRKYTLENYLLDPDIWYCYIRQFTIRYPKPGWSTVDEVRASIVELYKQCQSISAYNWTIHQARQENTESFLRLPENVRQYREHPNALAGIDVNQLLNDAQINSNYPIDLAQIYADHFNQLGKMSFQDLEQMISGKYVMTLLRENFPVQMKSKRSWEDVLGAYMSYSNNSPRELAEIVDAIWQNAHPTST